MPTAVRLGAIRAFVGDRALVAGTTLIANGLIVFALDLALAILLQRFLAAIGLVVTSGSPPLGLALGTPLHEGLGLAIVGVVRGVMIWLGGMLAGLTHVRLEVARRRDITRWALGTGSAAIGRVTTLYNDLTVGAAAAITNVFYLIGRVVLTLGTLAVLVWYSPLMTLGVLGAVALMAPAQWWIDRAIKHSTGTIQTSLAGAIDLNAGAVRNAAFLRIHGLAGSEVRRIDETMRAYDLHSRRYYSLSSLRSVMPQWLGLLVVIVVAAQGGTALGPDSTRVVAYLFLVLRLFQNLAEIARVSSNLLLNRPRLAAMWRWWRNDFAAAASRFDRELTVDEHVRPFGTPIGWRVENLSFAWDGGNATAIRALDFDVPAGSLLVVTGASGSGKTSLLLLLAGLIEPSSGRIALLERDGTTRDLQVERQRLMASLAYVGPDPFVVPGTIRDQLVLGLARAPDQARLEAALRLAHCEFVRQLPRGLDHPVSEQGGGLSAGQKQRLALARALLREPAVLLLDEATSNLDAETEAAVIDTLASLKGRMTIVATTHRAPILAIADRILNLDSSAATARSADSLAITATP